MKKPELSSGCSESSVQRVLEGPRIDIFSTLNPDLPKDPLFYRFYVIVDLGLPFESSLVTFLTCVFDVSWGSVSNSILSQKAPPKWRGGLRVPSPLEVFGGFGSPNCAAQAWGFS